ncbi:MAG: hypothetical protein RLY45_2331 [Actinomycetota bacterium]
MGDSGLRFQSPDDRPQYELALRARRPGLRLQPPYELVEASRAGTVDDDRVVGRTGDVHRQRDLVAVAQALLESGRVVARSKRCVDHRADVATEGAWIDRRRVAADHPGGLEPAYPVGR